MSAVGQYQALQARYEQVVSQVAAGELEDTPEVRAALVRMNFKLDLIRNELRLS